ncbi:general transcription factor IIH subunit 2-like [Biomphalaria glabrata]|uniref:General transcription factor IIH subunit n=1 Tax=Biomphalaria glabrata TaxID=6526 RepID=A0A9W2YQJ4_BIOGL|nr:general transcription factor IIH subunit 2-like [Biomphalaria glabrata]XP_055865020.1 general transcription factor IIH subunit 2-like [Biomphalaria glabrata]XP_055865021.1 general transcription factor IIH subunit 2-like [Biomphalaria glabrata]XP_055865022.1 general transcription factor IIH subunit 2-like [Biomphalaria glabrata]
MADDDDKGYRWETEYEKTWEELHEDESGSLKASIDDILHRAKKRLLTDRVTNVRLGMMRHLFIVVDGSSAMSDQDLKPTRLIATLKLLEFFVEEFFDQNPISQLGIIISRNKRAEVVTQLGGNPRRHVKALQTLSSQACQGEYSLQNSLELALSTLKHMPSHASREMLLIMGSLTTCDPGDVREVVKTVAKANIRCSVIGLSAEVRICKTLCQQTSGTYNVILEESHFKDLLNSHVTPAPASTTTDSSLIKMGFPHHGLGGDTEEKPSMCMCHLDSKTSEGFSTAGYFCPQCKSKYCELPIECKACGLTLVSAPHLARSYHHLFPPEPYKEFLTSDIILVGKVCCYACQIEILDPHVYVCEKCEQQFCLDCDLFAHETLHSCPGCASFRELQTVQATSLS